MGRAVLARARGRGPAGDRGPAVYLNDGFTGGETAFKTVSVSPARGSARLFVHGLWHEDSALSSGVKYVLRSDVLYGSEQV